MRRSFFRGLLFVALAAVSTAACSDDPPTPPTTPTPTPITETHTGRLTVNGAVTIQPITVNSAGSANLTVIGLAPDGAAVIGIALGVWSGTTCDVKLANDVAGVGSIVAGTVQDAGTLCARIFDVGRLTAPVDFTVEIEHF